MQIGRESRAECQRGLYDPLRFVLRLRPEMWRALEGVDQVANTAQINRDLVETYSTYLHETIHWWQYIGTTAGLILSLTQPVKTHVIRPLLRSFVASTKPHKSLVKFNALHGRSLAVQHQQELNVVLSHWHELEFNFLLNLRPSANPHLIDSVIENPYFESTGRSLHVALADTLWTLASTFDQESQFVPDSRRWESEFIELKRKEVEGFYYGSPVVLSAIGTQDIFEGQARFIQLQYLYLTSDRKLSWNEFGSRGLLSTEYIAAFKFYLEATETKWPASPISPETQLFLLLCDLALNPAEVIRLI